MIDFYRKNGFKMFPCKKDKSPNIQQTGIGWRDPQAHLTYAQAEEYMEKGNLVGAWLPEDFLVIDIDVNHFDKEGNTKPDGMKEFKILCAELGVEDPRTMVVKTGSGGHHLYYKVDRVFSQKSPAPSVDVRTHSGYVIAGGSPGYELFQDVPVLKLPDPFVKLLDSKGGEITRVEPKKCLSPKLLGKVLSKLDIGNFNTNDKWQDFVMSVIATSGNSEDVICMIRDWSLQDPAYQGDSSIETRIRSIMPVGGITVGSFLYALKQEGVSPYMCKQIRNEIGLNYELRSEEIVAHYTLPFSLNMEEFTNHLVLAKNFFYMKDQASTSRLIEFLLKDKVIYSRGEKQFYFFNGNRWEEMADVLGLFYNILVIISNECMPVFVKKDAPDSEELLNELLAILGSVSWRQKIEVAVRQSDIIGRSSIDWDSPRNMETLTFNDGVIDFSSGEIVYRIGEPEEWRRSYIDLTIDEFKKAKSPIEFRKFLDNAFPNGETRQTAEYALSLSVSGNGKTRKFQVWNGAGRNGKSLLIKIMEKVIGDRAISYKTNLLLQKNAVSDGNEVTPSLAMFQGALLAMSSETEEGKKISQGLVKNMTGDDTITANPKYKNPITFETTFQLVLATNYLPRFSAHDEAFLDRVLILPFHTSFYRNEEERLKFVKKKRKYILPSGDKNEIMSAIEQERAGILKFLVNKYLQIENSDFPVAKECSDLLKTYIEDNNDIGKFIDSFCVLDAPEKKGKPSFMSTRELTEFFNDENNTKYSAMWVKMRVEQNYPELTTGRRRIEGIVHRGFFGIYLDKSGVLTEEEEKEQEERGYGGFHNEA